ncbi:MAG: hypothetical protein WBV06_12350, partial [Acidimicrobiia bacterium]
MGTNNSSMDMAASGRQAYHFVPVAGVPPAQTEDSTATDATNRLSSPLFEGIDAGGVGEPVVIQVGGGAIDAAKTDGVAAGEVPGSMVVSETAAVASRSLSCRSIPGSIESPGWAYVGEVSAVPGGRGDFQYSNGASSSLGVGFKWSLGGSWSQGGT